MWKNSKQNRTEPDFKFDIPEYNDQEILNILKKRKYYQTEAVEIAKEEAFKRNLINSEENLLDEDFKVQPMKFGLFPNIEDNINKAKIRKSIARAILITGVFPVIWGFLRLNSGIQVEGAILVLAGLIWIFASAKLIQRVRYNYLNVLFIISALSIFYVGKILLKRAEIVFMDVFIIVAFYSFLAYGLPFIRRLQLSD